MVRGIKLTFSVHSPQNVLMKMRMGKKVISLEIFFFSFPLKLFFESALTLAHKAIFTFKTVSDEHEIF